MDDRLGALITVIIMRIILAPLFVMFAWNAIAWEFNLPQFGFWVPFCIFLARECMTTKVDLSRKN